MLKKILHASDGSEAADKAFAFALEMAKSNGAELHMVCVEEMQLVPGTREEVIGEKELANGKFADVVERAGKTAGDQGVNLESHLLVGHPVKAISEFVRENGFDALVIGFVGHSQLYGMLIGGTAERLVRLSPCSVIVVK